MECRLIKNEESGLGSAELYSSSALITRGMCHAFGENTSLPARQPEIFALRRRSDGNSILRIKQYIS